MNANNTKTIYDLVLNAGEKYSDKRFLSYEIYGEICNVTYGQFVEECKAVISWIQEYSVKLGRVVHVGLYGQNSHQYLVTMLGTMAAGSVVVPLDVQLSEDGLVDAVNRSEIDILFYDYKNDSVVQLIKDECPDVHEYYVFRENPREKNLNKIIKSYKGKHFINYVKEDDLAMILYTSGTTGKSKGVMLSQRNLVDNIFCSDVEHIDEHDVYLSVLPIHHVFCINGDVFLAIRYGDVVCLNQEMSKLTTNILLFQPSIMRMVPMMAKTLYNRAVLIAKQKKCDIKAVKEEVYGANLTRIVSGGGYLPPELAKAYEEIGIQIRQGYGMSECSPKITAPDWNRIDKVASVGKVVRNCVIRTVDGEIQVKSPSVMLGYYNDEERTKEALTEDGWLCTGDLGYVDDENFLFLTGRKKNLIILSNGENVAPEPIENLFINDNLVEEIIVMGDDDVVAAEIYPNFKYADVAGITDIEEALNEIIKKHNEELSTYQKINRLYIRKVPFEKTSSKKIIREQSLVHSKKEKKNKKYNKPVNDTQQRIFDLVAKAIGNEDFSIDDNFYDTGLDSLGSVMLIADLFDELKLTVTLDELMENATVEKLEAFMNNMVEHAVDYTIRDEYPLTGMEKYFAYVMRGNTTSNLPFLFRLNKKVDLEKLKSSIEKLMDVHPELKCLVQFNGQMFMNYRKDDRKVDIPIEELTDDQWDEVKDKLIVPFMFGKDEPLYHITIYKTKTANYLFFDVAHIMGDGMSMNILFEDLNKIYKGEEVAKCDYTFFELILDEMDKDARGLRDKNEAYLQDLMDGYKVNKSIFTNKISYSLEKGQNADISKRFENLNRKKVLNFCKKKGISENVLFLTAFNYCVGIFSDSDDTLISSIHSGRTDSRWNRIVGPLFLSYPFRYKKVAHEKVDDLLKRNANQIMNTMRLYISTLHSDEMFFQYQGDILNIDEIGGEKAEREQIKLDSMPFHMMVMSDNKGYRYVLRYWQNRFDREQLTTFLLCYECVLEAMLEETSVRKLRDHLPSRVFPLHYETTAAKINFEAGSNLIIDVPGKTKVKVYVFDDKLNKQPFGAWGELYVVGHPTMGYKEKIQYQYAEEGVYRTGKIARILPNGDLDILENGGRMIMSESVFGRKYYDLQLLEDTLRDYKGIKNAESYVAYGPKNTFYLTAEIELKRNVKAESVSIDELKAYIEETTNKDLVPAVIKIK